MFSICYIYASVSVRNDHSGYLNLYQATMFKFGTECSNTKARIDITDGMQAIRMYHK
jgi:hypothetical protein